jgi:hypothetical protein
MAVAIGEGGSGSSGDFVRRTGDTMSGPLTIDPPAGVGLLELNGNDAGTLFYGELAFQRNGQGRWLIRTGSNANPGNAVGSDLELHARNDDGSARSIPLQINRSTGLASFTGGILVPAGGLRVTTGGIIVSAGGLDVTGGTLLRGSAQVVGDGALYNHARSPGSTINAIGFRWATPNIVGNVDATGNIVVGTLSDRRLKTGIADLPADRALDMALSLRPVTYIPLDLDGSRVAPEQSVEHVGLIADEVEQVVPTAVGRAAGPDGLLSINLAEIVPLLVGAVQELTNRVEALEAAREEQP